MIVKVTLNPDGTFSMVRDYKRGLKRLFDAEDRSSGTWRFTDGILSLTTSGSSDRSRIGQVSSYQITSINNAEAIYVDTATGGRRIEWKLR